MCQVSGSVARLNYHMNVMKCITINITCILKEYQIKDSYSFMGSIPTPEMIYEGIIKN